MRALHMLRDAVLLPCGNSPKSYLKQGLGRSVSPLQQIHPFHQPALLSLSASRFFLLQLSPARLRVLGFQPQPLSSLPGTILSSLGNRRPAGPEAASEAEMQETLAAFQDLQVVAPAGRALEPSSPLQKGPKRSGAGALQCVCYGLGNFSSCVKARYQLAFLLLLLQELQIPHRCCHIFDPVFSELEIKVLNSLGLTVLLENEEGKRAVCAPTLFYMIHCGKALYNNLLWRNWSLEALPRMVIVGNSFRGMEERVPAKILQQEYPYIAKILEATREAALPSHPQYLEVFNDTSVHCFLLNKLRALPREIWECQEEPFYQEGDQLEIIQNKR
ncbi:SRR1-like protein isoform X1 [Pogona vitticeps]